MHSLNPSSADLPTLDLLRRLAQCGSLSQSAAQLGISISKASKMLGAARVLFGDKLFIRTNAGMLPTTRMRELEFTIGRVFADLEILLAEPHKPGWRTRRGRRPRGWSGLPSTTTVCADSQFQAASYKRSAASH